MIKVCHMTSVHDPEDVRIFYKECISLTNAGYDVYLVAKGDSYDKNGVHVVGIGEVKGGRINRMLNVTKQVYKKALEIDADIYHFHDPELLHYGLKLKRKGKKVIFDSHENTVNQIHEKKWIPALLRRPLYFLFDCYQKFICKKLDYIISVSPHICDYFKKITPHVKMITNYPKYVDYTISNKISNRSIGFAGGISEQWNHHNVINAIDKIDNVIYRLYGNGNCSYMDKLKTLPGWKKVDYRGRIRHEDVADALLRCDIGLSLLSYNRNTGGKVGTLGNTKIYEEMMVGLPIICTDFVLWKQMIEKYECGICVDPGNVNEIVCAVKYLLDNQEEAKRMGKNSCRAIREEFNWETQEIVLYDLYKEISLY